MPLETILLQITVKLLSLSTLTLAIFYFQFVLIKGLRKKMSRFLDEILRWDRSDKALVNLFDHLWRV